MPDKIYKKGCGHRCIRCWMNKLEHGNKLKLPKKKHILPAKEYPSYITERN